jgi:hypothetical protein
MTDESAAYADGWKDGMREGAQHVLMTFFKVMDELHWSTDVVTTNKAFAETLRRVDAVEDDEQRD